MVQPLTSHWVLPDPHIITNKTEGRHGTRRHIVFQPHGAPAPHIPNPIKQSLTSPSHPNPISRLQTHPTVSLTSHWVLQTPSDVLQHRIDKRNAERLMAVRQPTSQAGDDGDVGEATTHHLHMHKINIQRPGSGVMIIIQPNSQAGDGKVFAMQTCMNCACTGVEDRSGESVCGCSQVSFITKLKIKCLSKKALCSCVHTLFKLS